MSETLQHPPLRCSGIILAGGRATRMQGRDKGLEELLGEPLIAHVLRRLRPQVDDIVISANRNEARYAEFGWPVVSDAEANFAGPLAGIAAALPLCQQEWAVVVACDCPLLPLNLAEKLCAGLEAGVPLVMAHDGERLQPLCLLLHRRLLPALGKAVQAGEAKVERWCLEQAHRIAQITEPNGFLNINTEADKVLAAELLSKR